MAKYYTSEKHTQLLIALMKFHGIRKIIASPGATDICFVGSVQNDPYFEMYSSVDERSAAYMACGLAAESGEPVALVCTGSTASRNYVPALTEAFYRKLPVLAITSTQYLGRVGNNVQQVIDRSQQMKDLVNESIQLTEVHTKEQEKEAELNINKALIALKRQGGGTSHINLVTTYSKDFSVKTLPKVKGIEYTESLANMPSIQSYKKIAILVGTHKRWSENLLRAVERFCEKYNGVVLSDITAGYKGKYGINHALFNEFEGYGFANTDADLVISIGSDAKFSSGMKGEGKECETWLIDKSAKLRDTEGNLTRLFGMDALTFFEYYLSADVGSCTSQFAAQLRKEYEDVVAGLEDIPFSHVWVADKASKMYPDETILHLIERECTRPFYYFELRNDVDCCLADEILGMDGQAASLYGEALAVPNRIHFAVADSEIFKALSFVSNYKIEKNIRMIVISNAEEGHSIKEAAENCGCEYLGADSKGKFESCAEVFFDEKEKAVIFEVFITAENNQKAIDTLNRLLKRKDAPTEKISRKRIFGY